MPEPSKSGGVSLSLSKVLFRIALTAACTAIVVVGGAEFVARWIWPERSDPTCLIADNRLGHRYRPNCERTARIPEGFEVAYRYDDCGLRGSGVCGPSPANAVRIAVLGNSFSAGSNVSLSDSFAEIMARDLAGLCKRSIDLQNYSVEGYALFDQYFRVQDALKGKPSVVVLFVMPNDLFEIVGEQQMARRDDYGLVRRSSVLSPETAAAPLGARLRRLLSSSRLAVMIQHYLFNNLPFYVRSYLGRGDTAGYLSLRPAGSWTRRYADADLLISEIAARTRAAGSRLAVIALPQRVQVAMLDPSFGDNLHEQAKAFGAKIGQIAREHGALFVDVIDFLADKKSASSLFYPYDGHLTKVGHKVVGDALASSLFRSGAVCSARQD